MTNFNFAKSTSPDQQAAPEAKRQAAQVAPARTSGTGVSSPGINPSTPHKRRRLVAKIVIGFVVVSLLYSLVPKPQTAPTQDSSASLSPTALAEVRSVTNLAATWLSAHGSLEGFSPQLPPGVMVAEAGSSMVVSALISGVCAYDGVIHASVKSAGIDHSKQACTASLINRAASVLASSYQ